MTKEELLKRVAELEEEVGQIKERIKEDTGRFIPKEGDRYCYISSDGDVFDGYCSLISADFLRFRYGNVFETRLDAEKERDRRLAIVRINDKIDELNDGWVPDWNNTNEEKWYIYYDSEYKGFNTDFTFSLKVRIELHFFKNESVYADLFDEMEPDLKLVFGVK